MIYDDASPRFVSVLACCLKMSFYSPDSACFQMTASERFEYASHIHKLMDEDVSLRAKVMARQAENMEALEDAKAAKGFDVWR